MIKKLIFPLAVIFLVTLLYLLSTENVVPIPADDTHMALKEEAVCFDCHGEGKAYARQTDHPPKDRCFKCHEVIRKQP